jgi:Zn-dependent metalloprotease
MQYPLVYIEPVGGLMLNVKSHCQEDKFNRVTSHERKPCFVPPYVEDAIKAHLDGEQKRDYKNSLKLTKKARQLKNNKEQRVAHEVIGKVKNKDKIPQFYVYDAKHHTNAGILLKMKNGRYRDSTAQNAYLGAVETVELYRRHYNRNSLDNHGMDIKSVVHVDNHLANAYWDPAKKQIFYGDGDNVFLTFTSDRDVEGHELTHAVTEYTCNLDYELQSGALNESFSDMFGSQVKQQSLNQTVDQADWLIGDFVLADTPDGKKQSLRSMKNPGSAYDNKIIGRDPQPAHMGDYIDSPNTEEGDYGGVHINSGIPNKWFALSSISLGGHSWDYTGQVVYDVMNNRRIRHNATFSEFANATVTSSQTLFKEQPKVHDAIVTAWREVGVLK